MPGEQNQGLAHRSREAAHGLAATAATSVIPFRSWVRKLSGAEQHDALMQNAITSGAVRRAYLKGLGEARGCDPPATPSHVKAGSVAPTQDIELLRRFYPSAGP